MHNHKVLDHMPSSIKDLNRPCPVYIIVKLPRTRRNLETALIRLRPGQLWHIDFAFINTPSVRGFTCYIYFTYGSTAYPFA